jgi:hypothetical protein
VRRSSQLVIVILLAFITYANPQSEECDYFQSTTITYNLKEKSKRYRLTSEVSLLHEYVTEQSARENVHYIIEPFYAKISKIKGSLNSKSISKSSISSFYTDGEDVFISDDICHAIQIEKAIKPGDVFRCSYRKKFLDIAYLPIAYVPNAGHIREYRIVYNHPKDVTVDFEFYFPFGDIPYSVNRSESKQTILTFIDLPEIKFKQFFQHNQNQAAVLSTFYKDGVALNPSTPDGFVSWYGGLTELEPTLESSHQNILGNELAAVESDLEKLEIINDFVKNNVRYISSYRDSFAIIPHDPNEVLEGKYGDCKDKAILVSAIARLHNIDVHMATVGVEPKPQFEGTHAWLYDHVICHYTGPDTSLFFDPTQKYLSFGGLSESIIGKQAMILDRDYPRYEVIKSSLTHAHIKLFIEADIDSLDRASARVEVGNDYYAYSSYAYEELTGAKLENYLSQTIASIFYKIGLENFQFSEKDKYSIVFTADADLSDFIITTAKNKYIRKTPFVLVDRAMFDRANDSLPIQPENRMWAILTIDLGLSGFSAEADSIVSDHQFPLSFSAVLKPDSGRAKFSYEYFRPTKEMSGDNKHKFLSVLSWYKNRKKDMFVLSRED